MICSSCQTELPDEANYCWQCGKPQNKEVQLKQTKWEMCEIVCTKSSTGMRGWEFRAEANGPNGHYWASAPFFTNVNPHANIDQMSKENSNYVRYVVVSLVRAMMNDGWEPLELFGSHWYSHRFRRKLSHNGSV